MRIRRTIAVGFIAVFVALAGLATPLEHAFAVDTSSGRTSVSSNAATSDNLWKSVQSIGTYTIGAVVYAFTAGVGSYFAYFGAYLFGFAVSLSLNSLAYALTFLSSGWTMARDLANMFFIFVLIYIAIVVMLKAQTSEMTRSLAWVIVMALLINFSFFFTRVIIDAGNILALQFYNAIPSTLTLSTTGVKDLSAPIIAAVNPATLLSPEAFTKSGAGAGGGVFGKEFVALLLIYITMGVITFMLGIMFFFAGLHFVGRIVALWFIIIISPLAFVARTVKYFRPYYDKWQQALVLNSFYPAIFLFLFLIVTWFTTELAASNNTFASALSGARGTSAEETLAATLANVVVRLSIVLAMLYFAMSASKRASTWVAEVTGQATYGGSTWLSDRLARTGGFMYQQTGGRLAAKASRGISESRLGNIPVAGFLGYRMAKGFDKLAEKRVGGARSYTQFRKDKDAEMKARKGNLDQIRKRTQIHTSSQRIGQIEKELEQLKKDEAALADAKARGVPTTTAGVDKEHMERLSREKETLQKQIRDLNTNTITSFKAADIESIVKYLSESQMKAIRETDKLKTKEKDALDAKWHKEALEAPLAKAQKQLDLLNKIHETLKNNKMDESSDVMKGIAEFTKVARGATTVVNLKKINALMEKTNKEIEIQKEEVRQIPKGTEHKVERGEAIERMRRMNDAIKRLETLSEELKKLPRTVTGTNNTDELQLIGK